MKAFRDLQPGRAEPTGVDAPQRDRAVDEIGVLTLQRSAGNRAVAALMAKRLATAQSSSESVGRFVARASDAYPDGRERGTPGPGEVWPSSAQPLPVVQRIPGGKSDPTAVPSSGGQSTDPSKNAGQATPMSYAAGRVDNAFETVFKNQSTGLGLLGPTLKDKHADNDMVAMLAGLAVGAALTLILGPVGPAVEGALMGGAVEAAELGLGQKIAKTAIEDITKAAVEKTSELAKDYVKEKRKSKKENVDLFIESQQMALNKVTSYTKDQFLKNGPEIQGRSNGIVILAAMADKTLERATVAEDIQIATSAGQWASLERGSGSSAKAWADDTVEDSPEKGALEIEAEVAKPLPTSADLRITAANWRGVSKKVQDLVETHPGAQIKDLGVNLRITLTTPIGETKCEVLYDNQGQPIIPARSDYQTALQWLNSGRAELVMSGDTAGQLSAAANVGYWMYEKSVGELKFE